MAAPKEVGRPAKPNLDVPKGVRVERQPSGVSSLNSAGGEVPAGRYSK